ncbi:LysE family transporter [Thalassomonas viridans]|uniref:LysE family transporter n=1 Tax=Thalassomonas viridans TaxID=137584 RepID=A0AAE9Z3S9_9GAMM|nr:LysE family transporter [Thalassomonas viridans]WDE05539.1 LysE family transporter [Thalassomonas viridans]
MDLVTGLLLITSIHLLAAAAPGPDFVLVSQQTLRHGKKTGLLISLGITLGLSIHIIYSAFGLAAVIANSAMALWAIKIFGGGYLLYLGYQGLRSKASVQTEPDAEGGSEQGDRPGAAKSLGLGFLCNALNPKAPIYFVSLFTLVLSPDMPLYQIVVYGVWMMVIQLAWFSSVVLLLSRPAVNAGFQRFGHWIDRILGGAMIALGIKLLTSKIS